MRRSLQLLSGSAAVVLLAAAVAAGQSGPPTGGTVPLQSLAGSDWVLRYWAVDVPAPTRPEVTLALKGGRFVGRSGCNSYFAPVTSGISAGEVNIGPAGSTQMACPEAETAVEARFLTQLQSAKRFGVFKGQLTLFYRKGTGWAAMVFDEVRR